jgi:hypothetical protein
MARHGRNFESEFARARAKRPKPQAPPPPPRAESGPNSQTPPAPPPLLPSAAKSERFKQAVEQDGRVGKVEWKTVEGKPHGSCEHCPALARKHSVTIAFEGGVPRLSCTHEKSEQLLHYNEWLRATWTELYFNDERNRFWTREANPDKWVTFTEGTARDVLTRMEVPSQQQRQLLLDVRLRYNVRYAAPLAGYRSGVYTMFGNVILVTESPVIIPARKGTWPTLRQLFEGIWGEEQRPYLYGWVRSAYEGMSGGKRRIGQALVMVGERDSGKSLTQKLITRVLGGRVARPYSYMSGRTNFNYDLFGCEHLAIEDQKATTEWHTRVQFGTAIKDIVTSVEQWCHRKFADAVTLTPFWRLSISVNDEPENLCVLPPMDASIEDKIILLRTHKQPMPMPTTTQAEYDQFWTTLVNELPAWLYYLTQEWEMPSHLLTDEGASRFGMAHYHNPAVLQLINELENEFKMLRLLDMVLFAEGRTEAIDESAEWYEQRLLNSLMVAREAAKLFTFPRACGNYFAKLERKYPGRVKKHRTSERNTWILHPPPGNQPASTTQTWTGDLDFEH